MNAAEIARFGTTKALVIERFDRKWSKDGHLLRLPMEDCCQALSISPGRKYQSEGGPGMADILRLLSRSDGPAEDRKAFVKAQILFWLIGATDGYAKNFSVFLGPEGRFRMTPIYDVLTAPPSLDTKQILKKQMKQAMFVGDKRHYVMEYIERRHFIQTVVRAGLPKFIANNAFEEIEATAKEALTSVATALPSGFPGEIHESVAGALLSRLSAG